MQKLNDLTATELIKLISSKQCSVKDVATSCLNQTLQIEKDLSAWAHLNPDLIETQAKKLDAKLSSAKEKIGSMLGVPIGIKDIFNTKQMPTQMGSPIWKGFEPGNDARVVHYLQMADSLLFGKTVTAEFAVHAPGPTKNPHNLAHTPGTSSSGSAAAVAARMVPIALGTQTAGSIIRPSSYCGIFGFKPSFGLLPRTGVLKTTDTLDTIGFLARSVDDLRLTFDTIRVKGRDFPVSEKALNDTLRQNKCNSRPWKIGIVKGPKWNSAELYAQHAFLAWTKNLSALANVNVEEISLPAEFENAHQVHSTIYDRTLAYYFQREFEKHALVSSNIYEIITRGNQISLAQYKEALAAQDHLYMILDQLFDTKCDILIGLSTGGEALKDLNSVDRPDNCLIWTLCGAPAMNIPAFTGPLGLPFGAQIVGRRYNDYQLLDFAQLLQNSGLIPDIAYPQISYGTSSLTATKLTDHEVSKSLQSS